MFPFQSYAEMIDNCCCFFSCKSSWFITHVSKVSTWGGRHMNRCVHGQCVSWDTRVALKLSLVVSNLAVCVQMQCSLGLLYMHLFYFSSLQVHSEFSVIFPSGCTACPVFFLLSFWSLVGLTLVLFYLFLWSLKFYYVLSPSLSLYVVSLYQFPSATESIK